MRRTLDALLVASLCCFPSGCSRAEAPAAGQPGAEAQAAAQPPAALGAVGPIPGPRSAAPATSHPRIGDPSALALGRRLFQVYNCAGCHGEHAGGGMGPSLRDEVWIYGGEDEDVFDSIAQGRAYGMPAWGSLLPAEQIWFLTAYIQALRTPNEPDPPR